MPRIQKIIQRLFTNIFPDDTNPGEYEFFLEFETDGSEELKVLKEMYKDIINENLDNFILLSTIEETIIQIRCKQDDVIDKNIRLSLNGKDRNYIYARSLFYRRNHDMNDIRALVGKIDTYGSDLNKLENDSDFMEMCKDMIIEAMNKEIEQNLEKVKHVLV